MQRYSIVCYVGARDLEELEVRLDVGQKLSAEAPERRSVPFERIDRARSRDRTSLEPVRFDQVLESTHEPQRFPGRALRKPSLGSDPGTRIRDRRQDRLDLAPQVLERGREDECLT